LNKILSSQEKFGMVWLINTVVLIITIALASGERPLFLYKKTGGQIEKISTEYISYHRKTTISFYSTVIYYKDSKKTDKLVLGYVLKNDDLASANRVKARYYTVKGIKKAKQLLIDDQVIKSYNEIIGITVWMAGIISLILEIFIVRYYMKSWTFKMKPKRNK